MIKAVVTDIEGTTSSLSFVKDVLFPYSRERLPGFVRDHGREPEVARLLAETRGLAGAGLTDEQVVAQLIHWIDEDKKIPPLKALQGLVWEAGYREGSFQGHMYEDAARNLRKWHGRGIVLAVFSSGSVRAQQLLFAHTAYGDLTRLFSYYFDTNIGAKRDPGSYRKIATALGIEASAILFLSDIKEELDAARAAGMQTTWLVREAQAPDTAADHQQVRDFDAVVV